MTVASSLTGPASESARPAPASSTLKAIARGVMRRPLALASLAYLLALSLACALASWIAPFNPLTTNFDKVLSGPSAQHLLGTDELGRFLGRPR
jgi:ABC-type dipeptide/oligopeptide/nickel transport system permease subunit